MIHRDPMYPLPSSFQCQHLMKLQHSNGTRIPAWTPISPRFPSLPCTHGCVSGRVSEWSRSVMSVSPCIHLHSQDTEQPIHHYNHPHLPPTEPFSHTWPLAITSLLSKIFSFKMLHQDIPGSLVAKTPLSQSTGPEIENPECCNSDLVQPNKYRLKMSYQRSNPVCSPRGLASFTQRHSLESHPGCCVY